MRKRDFTFLDAAIVEALAHRPCRRDNLLGVQAVRDQALRLDVRRSGVSRGGSADTTISERLQVFDKAAALHTIWRQVAGASFDRRALHERYRPHTRFPPLALRIGNRDTRPLCLEPSRDYRGRPPGLDDAPGSFPTPKRKVCMSDSPQKKDSKFMAMAMCFGVAIGCAIGVAIDNPALGIGPGLAIGVAIGTYRSKSRR
jgi:hypothetical protein